VVNDPFIQLLNKGRGAGLRLTVATQTFADFAARTGSEAKARQVLGNINNLIALRVLDAETQQYVTDSLPKDAAEKRLAHPGQYHPLPKSVALYRQRRRAPGGGGGRSVPAGAPRQLPNLHYLAILAGGRLVKGRLPILGTPKATA